jgi:hypothetical protein
MCGDFLCVTLFLFLSHRANVVRLLLLCSAINGKYTIFDAKRMILFVYKAKYVAAKDIWHEIHPIRMEAKMDIYALQIT